MSKRFTIIVPAHLWPLACLIVAARGEVGRGMLCIRLVDASGDTFYASSAGGALDDPQTYLRFGLAQESWDYLQSLNAEPLPFTVEDVGAVFSEAIVIAHDDYDAEGKRVIVTDAVFTGLGLTITGIVTEFPEVV